LPVGSGIAVAMPPPLFVHRLMAQAPKMDGATVGRHALQPVVSIPRYRRGKGHVPTFYRHRRYSPRVNRRYRKQRYHIRPVRFALGIGTKSFRDRRPRTKMHDGGEALRRAAAQEGADQQVRGQEVDQRDATLRYAPVERALTLALSRTANGCPESKAKAILDAQSVRRSSRIVRRRSRPSLNCAHLYWPTPSNSAWTVAKNLLAWGGEAPAAP
jgi:hypothetical protein